MDIRDLAAMLNERLDRLDNKLDAVQEHMGQIDVTLAQNTKDIAYHIKRTDALEQRVEQVADEMKPVREHVARLKGIGWFLGVCAAVLGVLATLRSLID